MWRVRARGRLIWKRLQIRLEPEGRVVLVTVPCASRRVGLSWRWGQVDRDRGSVTLSGAQADFGNFVSPRARSRLVEAGSSRRIERRVRLNLDFPGDAIGPQVFGLSDWRGVS